MDEFTEATPSLDAGITPEEARNVFGILDLMGEGKLRTEELLVALKPDVDGAAPAPDFLSNAAGATPPANTSGLPANTSDPPANTSDQPPPSAEPCAELRSMAIVQEALRAKGDGLASALRAMDNNGDGEISSREFCRAVSRLDNVDVAHEEASALYKHLLAQRPQAESGKALSAKLTIDEAVRLFAQPAAALAAAEAAMAQTPATQRTSAAEASSAPAAATDKPGPLQPAQPAAEPRAEQPVAAPAADGASSAAISAPAHDKNDLIDATTTASNTNSDKVGAADMPVAAGGEPPAVADRMDAATTASSSSNEKKLVDQDGEEEEEMAADAMLASVKRAVRQRRTSLAAAFQLHAASNRISASLRSLSRTTRNPKHQTPNTEYQIPAW